MGVFIKAKKLGDHATMWADADLKLSQPFFACNFHVDALAEKALVALRAEHPGVEFSVVECEPDDPEHPWR